MQAPPDDVLEGWPKPNYVDPVTHGRSKIVLNVVLYAILLCIVALRMVTRIWLRKSFGGDDVLILLALVWHCTVAWTREWYIDDEISGTDNGLFHNFYISRHEISVDTTFCKCYHSIFPESSLTCVNSGTSPLIKSQTV